MKPTGMVVAVAIAALLVGTTAQAQVTSTSNTNTTTTASTSASNEGVSLANTFNTNVPTDTKSTVKYSGFYGSNTSVGLGSFSNSFSSDYCGGSAQAGISIPYITGAFGQPVLGEPGVGCLLLRGYERTMQGSTAFGNAAAAARAAKDEETAKQLAAMSVKLANGGINILCSLHETIREAYKDAGIQCPPTRKETAEASKQAAIAKNEPTDNLVRARAGLPLLPEVK